MALSFCDVLDPPRWPTARARSLARRKYASLRVLHVRMMPKTGSVLVSRRKVLDGPRFGQLRPDLTRNLRAMFGPDWSHDLDHTFGQRLAKVWPRPGPASARVRPTSANIGPTSVKIDHKWCSLGLLGLMSPPPRGQTICVGQFLVVLLCRSPWGGALLAYVVHVVPSASNPLLRNLPTPKKENPPGHLGAECESARHQSLRTGMLCLPLSALTWAGQVAVEWPKQGGARTVSTPLHAARLKRGPWPRWGMPTERERAKAQTGQCSRDEVHVAATAVSVPSVSSMSWIAACVVVSLQNEMMQRTREVERLEKELEKDN